MYKLGVCPYPYEAENTVRENLKKSFKILRLFELSLPAVRLDMPSLC
jgi:hypothetical protein